MTGSNDCTRFDACMDLLIGDRSLLGPEQTQFIRNHLACCARCSLQASFVEGLGHLEQDEESEHPPLAQDVLRRKFDRLMERQHHRNPTPSMGSGWGWYLAGLTATVVILIIWMLWPAGVIRGKGAVLAQKSPPCCTLQVSQLQGNICRNGQSIQDGDKLRMGDRIQSFSGSMRLTLADDSQLVVHKQTVLKVLQATERHQHFRMEQGRALFQVTPLAAGHSFELELPAGLIRVVGTIFEVNYVSEELGIKVWEGKVLFIPNAGQQRMINAGHGFHAKLGVYSLTEHKTDSLPSKSQPQAEPVLENNRLLAHRKRSPSTKTRRARRAKKKKRFRSDEKDRHEDRVSDRSPARPKSSVYTPSRQTLGLNQSPQTPRETMAQLFDAARRLRSEGRWAEVVKTYRRIIRQYPASSEATTCLVLMGKVQLEKLKDAKAAIASFRQYLDLVDSGALVEETRWSLAAALRQIGDKQEEVRVLRSFVKNHPKSRFCGLARKRLEALE